LSPASLSPLQLVERGSVETVRGVSLASHHLADADVAERQRQEARRTVADAHPAVRERAHWTTATQGGQGAVREIADRLLQAQGHWDDLVAGYLAGP
ncbi:MAG: hypothetical protein ABEK42_00930, partial [Thiohalorhabdaceae bacterium]